MRRTFKQAAAGAAAVMMLCALGACANTDNSGSSAPETSQVSSGDSAPSLAQVNEANDAQAPQAQSDMDELTKKVEELSARVEELESITGEYEFGDEIHEVYDDTAVVEAYRSKDLSGLTDPKDKFIYESLVDAVDEIITDGMTDYEKEKAVYDYIFYGTQFNEENLSPVDFDEGEDNSHNPYGFFHDHTTICVGNATTFKLFMDVLGIDCEIIHSTEDGEHAWNIVELDGDWYHVDVTFDGGYETPLYSCFNVTDEVKEAAGYPWNEEDFHPCTATKYNYVMHNAEKLKDVYALPKAMKDYLGQGNTAMYVSLPVPEDVEPEAFAWEVKSVVDSLMSDRYYFSTGEPMYDEDRLILTISIYDNEYEEYEEYYPEDQDTGVDRDKLREAFEKDLGGRVTMTDEDTWR